MLLQVPYGLNKIVFDIPKRNLAGLLLPKPIAVSRPLSSLVAQALRHPIGTAPLRSLVDVRCKVAILCEDITRPTPLDILLPYVLEELQHAGVSNENITIVIALGSHRPMSAEELQAKLGPSICENYMVVNSEFRDSRQLAYIGTTTGEVDIYVDRRVVEADFKIGVGSIFPHPVAGYTGGAKILFPGVAGQATVARFHLSAALYGRNFFGEVDNPVRHEMETWVDHVGLNFIVNAVLTPGGEVYKVVAGHYVMAHRHGVKYCHAIYGVEANVQADAVIVGSSPLDLDFWQASKAIIAGEKVVKNGGTIVLLTPCYEGVGPHQSFLYFCGVNNIKKHLSLAWQGKLRSTEVLPLSVAALLHYVRQKAEIIVISEGLKRSDIATAGFKQMDDVHDALDYIFAKHGSNAKIYVIPYGGHTCPVLQISNKA